MTDLQSPRNAGDPRLIVALDFPDAESALALAHRLDPASCRLKVGKELFTVAGPELVRQLVGLGFGIFLDLKFHDIPTTVRKACEAASRLGVWMLNVHASGGLPMMQAARQGVQDSGRHPLLIAVTVLTSMDAAILRQTGVVRELPEQVAQLAALTQQAALDGVVCSAQEASLLRRQLGEAFQLVTPGIRPAWAGSDDQSRIVTPADAIRLGANYLVVGRPVTKAADPIEAVARINQEISPSQAK